MRPTQLKDAIRNIRRHRVSYLSVIVIAFLGAAAFLGIDYAGCALRRNCSRMYNDANYRDIEIVSTLALTEEDIDAVWQTDGVSDVEQVWQTKAKVSSGQVRQDADVISLTERINRPQVTDGRLPRKRLECAVEQRLAEQMDWHIGDNIELCGADGGTAAYLKSSGYTVTGFVSHPDHTNLNVPDTLYVMVLPEAFDIDGIYDCCMKAEVTIDRKAAPDRFGKRYGREVAEVCGRLETLGKERSAILDEIYRENFVDEDYDTEPRWFVLDGHGNACFVQLIYGSGNLFSMESTFALLFIVVGALVIYASITRMVDEQRTVVGTAKALGLTAGEIAAKYLLYGVSATLIGLTAGILTARFGMEKFILHTYDRYYTFDITAPMTAVRPTVTVLTAGLMLAAAASLFSCRKLMQLPATELMRAKVPQKHLCPKGKSRHLLSLRTRLILTNIRRDLGRVIVTVACVAGCCSLVVIGFTLKSAVDGSPEKQYGTIVDYDLRVRFDTDTCPGAADSIAEVLDRAGAEHTALYSTFVTYRITNIQTAELICTDIGEFGEMFHMRGIDTGEPIVPTEEGVFIQKRLAEEYGLREGSEFGITVGGKKECTVKVAGIFDNYIGRPMVMSEEYYEKLTGRKYLPNEYAVKLNGADEGELISALSQVSGFESAKASDADRAIFEASTSAVTVIVMLFILMSAVMAGFVLLNLTVSDILHKKTELTVMRINGFTIREVRGYVLREAAMTRVIGMIAGIIFGSVTAYRIERSMEQPFVQFDRGISLTAWIAGIGITIIFTVLIDVIALRPIKNLKLSELNKI